MADPVLVTVTVWVLLVVLTNWFPNTRVELETLAAGVGPNPDVCGPPPHPNIDAKMRAAKDP